MAENKTKPTDVSVEEFLTTVPPGKVADSLVLIEMMREISGEDPVMWGPSIIGFGRYTYTYASGYGGEAGKIGFSPRKAAFSIYFTDGLDGRQDQLARLGKHRAARGCLYVNKLADVDLDVLRDMIADSWADVTDFDES